VANQKTKPKGGERIRAPRLSSSKNVYKMGQNWSKMIFSQKLDGGRGLMHLYYVDLVHDIIVRGAVRAGRMATELRAGSAFLLFRHARMSQGPTPSPA